MDPGVLLEEWIPALLVLVRLLLPLTILRFPLPGMLLSALAVDSVERDILIRTLSISEMEYQRLDKFLDAHYMLFAYMAMLRNWSSAGALRLGRILFFHRLLGIALFEATGLRWIFVLFPNAFDFYFLTYEFLRLWWRPMAIRSQVWRLIAVVVAASVLPKEYWIHVARMSTSDFVKVQVLGMPHDMPWSRVPVEIPWFLPAAGISALLLALILDLGLRRARRSPGLERRTEGAPLDVDREPGVPRRHLTGQPLPWLGDRLPRWVPMDRSALLLLLAVIAGGALGTGMGGAGVIFAAWAALALANGWTQRHRAREGAPWLSFPAELAWRVGLAALLLGVQIPAAAALGVGLGAIPAGIILVWGPLTLALHDRVLVVHRRRFPPGEAGE